jgi:hypothetical protein
VRKGRSTSWPAGTGLQRASFTGSGITFDIGTGVTCRKIRRPLFQVAYKRDPDAKVICWFKPPSR